MGWLDFWKPKQIKESRTSERGKQARQLRESLDSWEMFDFLRDRYYGNGQWYFPLGGIPAVGGTTNKIQGRNQYVFYTEQDLRFQRDAARILYASEPVAKAIEGNLNAFVIGKGMKYKLCLRKGMESKATEEQLQEYQQLLDAWMDEQQWPEREQECFASKVVDGEFFLRRIKSGGKIRYIRIEPEHIQNPEGMTFEDGWWIGVKYDKKDYETPVAYGYKLYGSDWEEIPADEMIHFKANVSRNVARGVSDLYPILDDLDSIAKLSDNMRAGATAQAEIAYMISVTGATPNSITSFNDDQAEVSVTNPYTGNTEKSRRSQPGSVKCHGDNVQFTTLPQGAGLSYIAIYQNAMRIIASAFCMPEYMLTSDASNANYSSTLVAGTPFYRYVEREQSKLKRPFKQCLMLVLDQLYVDLQVPTDLREALDIDVTCDSPVVVDPYQDAQRRDIEVRNGVLSQTRWMMEQGRDPQQEQQWIDEWRDANMEAVQAQQGIFPPDQQPEKPAVKEAWDESKHPRVEAGDSRGGQFAIRHDHLNSYEGQHDYVATYTKKGKTLGKLSYTLHGNEISVKHVEVDKNSRRQGISTKLYDSMLAEHPEHTLSRSMMTPEGGKFRAAYDAKHQDRLTKKKETVEPKAIGDDVWNVYYTLKADGTLPKELDDLVDQMIDYDRAVKFWEPGDETPVMPDVKRLVELGNKSS